MPLLDDPVVKSAPCGASHGSFPGLHHGSPVRVLGWFVSVEAPLGDSSGADVASGAGGYAPSPGMACPSHVDRCIMK
eukprot:8473194-Heterocapsa_arctica.AAC.1